VNVSQHQVSRNQCSSQSTSSSTSASTLARPGIQPVVAPARMPRALLIITGVRSRPRIGREWTPPIGRHPVDSGGPGGHVQPQTDTPVGRLDGGPILAVDKGPRPPGGDDHVATGEHGPSAPRRFDRSKDYPSPVPQKKMSAD